MAKKKDVDEIEEWTGDRRDAVYAALAKGDADAVRELLALFPGLKQTDFFPMDKKALAGFERLASENAELRREVVQWLADERPGVRTGGLFLAKRLNCFDEESILSVVPVMSQRLEAKQAVLQRLRPHDRNNWQPGKEWRESVNLLRELIPKFGGSKWRECMEAVAEGPRSSWGFPFYWPRAPKEQPRESADGTKPVPPAQPAKLDIALLAAEVVRRSKSDPEPGETPQDVTARRTSIKEFVRTLVGANLIGAAKDIAASTDGLKRAGIRDAMEIGRHLPFSEAAHLGIDESAVWEFVDWARTFLADHLERRARTRHAEFAEACIPFVGDESFRRAMLRREAGSLIEDNWYGPKRFVEYAVSSLIHGIKSEWLFRHYRPAHFAFTDLNARDHASCSESLRQSSAPDTPRWTRDSPKELARLIVADGVDGARMWLRTIMAVPIDEPIPVARDAAAAIRAWFAREGDAAVRALDEWFVGDLWTDHAFAALCIEALSLDDGRAALGAILRRMAAEIRPRDPVDTDSLARAMRMGGRLRCPEALGPWPEAFVLHHARRAMVRSLLSGIAESGPWPDFEEPLAAWERNNPWAPRERMAHPAQCPGAFARAEYAARHTDYSHVLRVEESPNAGSTDDLGARWVELAAWRFKDGESIFGFRDGRPIEEHVRRVEALDSLSTVCWLDEVAFMEKWIREERDAVRTFAAAILEKWKALRQQPEYNPRYRGPGRDALKSLLIDDEWTPPVEMLADYAREAPEHLLAAAARCLRADEAAFLDVLREWRIGRHDDGREFCPPLQSQLLRAMVDHPAVAPVATIRLVECLRSSAPHEVDWAFPIVFEQPERIQGTGEDFLDLVRGGLWQAQAAARSRIAVTRIHLMARHGRTAKDRVFAALEEVFQLDDPTAWRKAADAMREFRKELPHLALANPERVRELIARDPKKHGAIFRGLVE